VHIKLLFDNLTIYMNYYKIYQSQKLRTWTTQWQKYYKQEANFKEIDLPSLLFFKPFGNNYLIKNNFFAQDKTRIIVS